MAIAGALLTIPILLSVIYYDGADEWSWSYLMMIALNLVLFASDAGRHIGLDGVLERGPAAARRALVTVGAVAAVVGVLGLYVARSISFAGNEAALLGSDAGFVDDAGALVRRWELKFLFFNPLWAILTILLGLLLVGGARRALAAWIGAAGFTALAVVGFVAGTVDYVRSDGSIQVVSTASNVAAWAGAALAGALLARRLAGGVAPVRG